MATKKKTSNPGLAKRSGAGQKPALPAGRQVARITIPLYTKSGNKGGSIALPGEIFGQKPNLKLLAQYVRVFLSNQRRAHAKTKRRGEVHGSTRKIYRQKGTGRARHGALSAPIFVGGGIAHGPKGIENYKLNLSAKMKKKALISALSAKAGDVVVADIEKVEPKTKNVAAALTKMQVGGPATLVYGGTKTLFQAARNIAGLSVIPATQISVYEILTNAKLIFTKEGLEQLKTRFTGGKNAGN